MPLSPDLTQRIKTLLAAHPVILFMKGAPNEPRCGFSQHAVEMLHAVDADMHTVDILADEELRAGLKEYADWPTYPQLWVRGELIGGHDIMEEMYESGELKAAVHA